MPEHDRHSRTLPEIIFEPTHYENARLVNQAGLFTITPSGGDNLVSAILNELAENEVIDPSQPMDVARFVSKIHIPNEHRVECLNTLRKMNIHHANLFPDPGGASKYCNDWLARVIDEERRGEEAARALERQRTHEREQQEQVEQQETATADTLLIADRVISAGAITNLMQKTLGFDGQFSPNALAPLSPKIITLYERTAETDWPDRDASRLRLKLEFRKFLMSNGVNKSVAEIGALRLVELFEASWKAANTPAVEGAP